MLTWKPLFYVRKQILICNFKTATHFRHGVHVGGFDFVRDMDKCRDSFGQMIESFETLKCNWIQIQPCVDFIDSEDNDVTW